MNNKHRFTLEKYKGPASRYTCPSCGQQRKFSRYIDTDTGAHLDPRAGRCDRLDHCGYHYTPRQFFEDNKLFSQPKVAWRGRQPRTEEVAWQGRQPRTEEVDWRARPPRTEEMDWQARLPRTENKSSAAPGADWRARQAQTEKNTVATRVLQSPLWEGLEGCSFLPQKAVFDSMDDLRHNHFMSYLRSRFTQREVDRLVVSYYIGTSTHWPGATVFWQIDAQERVRTGKVMLYDPASGKRVKEPAARISWMHSLLGLKDYRLQQCLFGEHLLTIRPQRRIAIAESEKTAMIASVYMPEMCWMATGGKEGLTAERLALLRGREVLLCPDQGACELWSRRAHELGHLGRIRVSRLLEQLGSQGSDMADHLVR